MDVFDKIRGWAEDRNLIEGSNPTFQYVKLVEEVNELARAIINKDDAEFIDAIGDCVVVLTIMARQKGYAIEDCIASAWLEIKDRKGRLVNGVFVKEE